jgi:hypothetical protein
VHRQERLAAGRRRFDQSRGRLGTQTLEQYLQPSRRLGVVGARIVADAVRV